MSQAMTMDSATEDVQEAVEETAEYVRENEPVPAGKLFAEMGYDTDTEVGVRVRFLEHTEVVKRDVGDGDVERYEYVIEEGE